jgi:hypothetical protein
VQYHGLTVFLVETLFSPFCLSAGRDRGDRGRGGSTENPAGHSTWRRNSRRCALQQLGRFEIDRRHDAVAKRRAVSSPRTHNNPDILRRSADAGRPGPHAADFTGDSVRPRDPPFPWDILVVRFSGAADQPNSGEGHMLFPTLLDGLASALRPLHHSQVFQHSMRYRETCRHRVTFGDLQ